MLIHTHPLKNNSKWEGKQAHEVEWESQPEEGLREQKIDSASGTCVMLDEFPDVPTLQILYLLMIIRHLHLQSFLLEQKTKYVPGLEHFTESPINGSWPCTPERSVKNRIWV